jgi:hypothetical protein
MSKIFGISAAIALALTIGLSSTPGSARVGQRCEGFAGRTCGPHEFCQMPTGVCSRPDAEGRCAFVPELCNRIFRPVCGCNHVTYSNDCERMAHRVSKLHNGRC